jgi:hypothetical protein
MRIKIIVVFILSLASNTAYSQSENKLIEEQIIKEFGIINGLIFKARLENCNYSFQYNILTEFSKINELDSLNNGNKLKIVIPSNYWDSLYTKSLKGCFAPELKDLIDYYESDSLYFLLSKQNISHVKVINNIYNYIEVSGPYTPELTFNPAPKGISSFVLSRPLISTNFLTRSLARVGDNYVHFNEYSNHVFLINEVDRIFKVVDLYPILKPISDKILKHAFANSEKLEIIKMKRDSLVRGSIVYGNKLEFALHSISAGDDCFFITALVSFPTGAGNRQKNRIIKLILDNNLNLINWFDDPNIPDTYLGINAALSNSKEIVVDMLYPVKTDNKGNIKTSYSGKIVDNIFHYLEPINFTIPKSFYNSHSDHLYSELGTKNEKGIIFSSCYPGFIDGDRSVHLSFLDSASFDELHCVTKIKNGYEAIATHANPNYIAKYIVNNEGGLRQTITTDVSMFRFTSNMVYSSGKMSFISKDKWGSEQMPHKFVSIAVQ